MGKIKITTAEKRIKEELTNNKKYLDTWLENLAVVIKENLNIPYSQAHKTAEVYINKFLNNNSEYDTCYIYAAEFDSSITKIGISKDVESRLKTLMNQSGRQLTQYIKIKVDDGSHFKIEKKLHDIFKNFRLNGEYFNCSFDTVKKELIKVSLNFKGEIKCI